MERVECCSCGKSFEISKELAKFKDSHCFEAKCPECAEKEVGVEKFEEMVSAAIECMTRSETD